MFSKDVAHVLFVRAGERVSPAGFWWWFWQIVPPLAIPAFLFVPFDIGTGIFYLALFVAVAVSLCSLVWRWVRNTVLHFRGWAWLIPPPRPVLTLVAYELLSVALSQSIDAAERLASDTAKSVQMQCDRDRRCPGFVASWRAAGGNGTAREAGRWLKYQMTYRTVGDRQGFEVTIVFSMDGWKTWSGGVGKGVSMDSSTD